MLGLDLVACSLLPNDSLLGPMSNAAGICGSPLIPLLFREILDPLAGFGRRLRQDVLDVDLIGQVQRGCVAGQQAFQP